MKKIITIALVLSIPLIVFADIYKWTDEQGSVHATDDISQAPPEIQDKYKPKDTKSQPDPYVSRIPIRPPTDYYRQVIEYWKDPQTNISYKLPLNSNQINKDRQRIIEEKKKVKAAKTAAGIFFLAIILSGIIYFTLWIWAFLDILKNQFAGNDKLIWWLTITMIPILGLIAYATIGKNQKIKDEDMDF